MNIHLIIVVTLKCNRSCPLCSQQTVMRSDPEYDMPFSEFQEILESSKRRGIRYATIEITGGEPTMWPWFREGMRLLHSIDVADWNTFVTNGNNAEEVSQIANLYSPVYGVSKSSNATSDQVFIHKNRNPGIFFVDHKHKPCPVSFFPNAHPSQCCLDVDRNGRRVTQLAYYKGNIYHCHNAVHLVGEQGAVPFESDFIDHFRKEPRDQEMCGKCLCNSHVWNQVS